MTPDCELLATFARTNSEDAFAEVVKRHVNLVYSAALRQVGGDEHFAKDVAQSVFTDLARKADSLARRETLTGWLYTSAHFAAAKIVRTETRRRDREETFMRETISETAPELDWEKLRPVLDAAMQQLKEADRDAILLRYFENRPFAEVGGQLGLNENAARMRVERALEKLRAVFAKRGVVTTATLASVISANAVQAAPASLVAPITTAAIAAAGAGTFTIMKLFTAAKLKLALAAIIAAGGVTFFLLQRQAQEKLHDENQILSQQVAQMQTGNEDLSNRLAVAVDSEKRLQGQTSELLKLRGEFGVLKNKAGLLTRENDALKAQLKNRADLDLRSGTNIATPMQVHIKARFISLPKGALAGSGNFLGTLGSDGKSFTCIINDDSLRVILKQFEKIEGAEILGEPEVVTTSGRQCQMRVTEIITVITNMTLIETNGETGMAPQTESVETGPVLDATPEISLDGFMIALPVTASVVEFFGYNSPTNTTLAYTKTGESVNLPVISPQFDTSQTEASVNLWDNQTLVLKLNRKQVSPHAAMNDAVSNVKSKASERDTLVFVTATIVDPAGNRVHREEQVSKKQEVIPPPPPASN